MSGTDSLIAELRGHLEHGISSEAIEAAADAIATLTAELDRVKLHLSAWEDSARINKARADEATAERDALREALAASELHRAANALLNNLWVGVGSGARSHDENWREFDRRYPGVKWLHEELRAARALQGSSSADEGRGT